METVKRFTSSQEAETTAPACDVGDCDAPKCVVDAAFEGGKSGVETRFDGSHSQVKPLELFDLSVADMQTLENLFESQYPLCLRQLAEVFYVTLLEHEELRAIEVGLLARAAVDQADALSSSEFSGEAVLIASDHENERRAAQRRQLVADVIARADELEALRPGLIDSGVCDRLALRFGTNAGSVRRILQAEKRRRSDHESLSRVAQRRQLVAGVIARADQLEALSERLLIDSGLCDRLALGFDTTASSVRRILQEEKRRRRRALPVADAAAEAKKRARSARTAAQHPAPQENFWDKLGHAWAAPCADSDRPLQLVAVDHFDATDSDRALLLEAVDHFDAMPCRPELDTEKAP